MTAARAPLRSAVSDSRARVFRFALPILVVALTVLGTGIYGGAVGTAAVSVLSPHPSVTPAAASTAGGGTTTWGWTQLAEAQAPSPRAGAAMVYDAADGYTLLFGGCPSQGLAYWTHSCTASGDTWTLQNGSWTNITTSLSVSPPGRSDAGIAYDSADQCVVLFGGFNGTTVYNDTWTYHAGQWTNVTPAQSPSPRFEPGMVGDAAAGDVVLFGGSNSSSPYAVSYNDTWTYQGGAWTPVPTSVAPSPRFSMTMSYDPTSQWVLLFGGWSASQPNSFGDTWTFANGTWTNITGPVGPSPRNYAAMAYDPALNASIMTGGHVGQNAYNDAWAENATDGWVELNTGNAPPARWGLDLSYDATSNQLYLFGGVDALSDYYNDLWTLTPITPVHYTWGWTQLVTPTAPSPRAGAAMVYDPAEGYSLLFGGCPSSNLAYWTHSCTAVGDTWTLHNGSWANITASLSVAPPARADAGIAYDNEDQSVLLFGGFDGATVYNDTWIFHAGQWTNVSPAQSPSPRFAPAMTGDASAGDVVLFGGSNSSSPYAISYNDTWTFQNGSWTQVFPPLAPAPRFSMTMSYDSTSQLVVLFSGWSASQPNSFGDTWTFANGAWTNITTPFGPSPRNYAAMAFDPAIGASVMTGGHVGQNAYNDTWAENASAGWVSVPTAAAPPPRWGLDLTYDATAGALYLFGGVNANSLFFNDTWVFGQNGSTGALTTFYPVTLRETGLPSSISWIATLDGILGRGSTAAGSTIAFSVGNGSYPYTVSSVVGPVVNGSASTYVPTPSTGWVNVSGGPTTVGVHFAASGGLFAIDLVESGLPNGTSWSASLGSTSVTSTTHTIQFGEPNGTYVLAVGTVGNYTANYTSPVVVAGASVRATINFTTPIYPIRVSETGLPSGAEWTVSATNTATLVITSAGSTGASAILWLVRGGYTVSVTGPAGFQAALSQITLSVDGAAPPTLAATFAATVFTHTTAATLPAITLAALVVIGLVAIVGAGWGYQKLEFRRRREDAQRWFREFQRPPPGDQGPPPQ
ncbi:MAG: hypothetical protein L3J92_03620 [Thermoplasmata archaeon]|jgi:hypothetical protein|nr:hypothetical protein [Thermoplasmata archaeon]